MLSREYHESILDLMVDQDLQRLRVIVQASESPLNPPRPLNLHQRLLIRSLAGALYAVGASVRLLGDSISHLQRLRILR